MVKFVWRVLSVRDQVLWTLSGRLGKMSGHFYNLIGKSEKDD
jgi:hypothetical protein